jgi:thiol:disulfide interchange protein DsbD
MEYVKYVFGFVLLGMAVWMAARLLPPPATLAFWAALAMTASVFVGAFDTLGSDATTGRRLRKGAGMALALYALILGIGAASGGGDPLRPLTQLTLFQAPAAGSPALDFAGVSSSAELHGAIAAASAEGRPALVYFTADWCVTCAAIERDVLPAPQVADSLSGFRRFKVNLSRLDDANRSLMQELAVVGPPTMIFFAPNATEVEHTRLVGEVSIDSIVASAAQANR